VQWSLSAESGLVHRSKKHLYSITSSAMESTPGRHLDAERSHRLKVDDELEFGWPPYGAAPCGATLFGWPPCGAITDRN
jgi:hypothetical protein